MKHERTRQEIEEMETFRDCQHDEQESRDYRRQKAIERAVEAADRIIMDASDGSVEETNYLTGMVAERFVKKANQAFISAMLKKDIGV